jgi:protein-disulfide isomerase
MKKIHFSLVLATLPAALFFTISTTRAAAQDTLDTVLKPPQGSEVAIIVFEDLQCPDCAHAAPALAQAAKAHKIPVIRHDFPLKRHLWAHEAAVMARFFDATSKDLGNEFREYIYGKQPDINAENLRSYAEKFAAAPEHKMSFPQIYDPDGKLAALVDADLDLAKALNLKHTPTVYVVSSRNPNKPYIELEEPTDEDLYATVDAMMKN